MDEIRNRFLRDRVLTATPAQRVVMLYDRLALDLVRARSAGEPADAGPHLSHATQIVAELLGSLEHSAGPLADNLAGLYSYLVKILMDAQITRDLSSVDAAASVVDTLRDAWTQVAEGVAGARPDAARPLAGVTSWTA